MVFYKPSKRPTTEITPSLFLQRMITTPPFDKNFTVQITNVVEDLDGDGTEDHYDDDIDGDGLTNAQELLYGSDPLDESSGNRPPGDINASNLSIAENSAIGTVIGEFNATDPDGDTNITYSISLTRRDYGWMRRKPTQFSIPMVT